MAIRLEDLPEELRNVLQPPATSNGRQPGISADRIHGAAIDALYTLRNLSKPDKRRALNRAIKLLDA